MFKGRGLGVATVVEGDAGVDDAEPGDGQERADTRPEGDLPADGGVPDHSPEALAPDAAPDAPAPLADALDMAPDAPAPDVPAADAAERDAAMEAAPLDTAPDGAATGASCTANAGCQSGFCVAGLCCDGACTGPCRACTAERTGQPDGTCAPVTAGKTDPGCAREEATTCGRDGTCDGSGACRRYPDGTVCGGVCCNSGPGGRKPCTFVCRAGACDTATPIPGTACQALNCCCATGGPAGGPSCALATACPSTCQ
jgi:hypothetical protein